MLRVVIAKLDLHGHDRCVWVVARALRDAGMEVIYAGLHQTPEQVVQAAIQEDADAICVSVISRAHMTLVPRVLDLLWEAGVDDIRVLVGGRIAMEDAVQLKEQGVAEVFNPGTPMADVVATLRGAHARPSACPEPQ